MGGPGWFRGPHRPGCGGRSCCSSSHIHCTQGRCHCTQGCCCTCSCSCNLHCTQADCTCSCNLHCPCPCSIRQGHGCPCSHCSPDILLCPPGGQPPVSAWICSFHWSSFPRRFGSCCCCCCSCCGSCWRRSGGCLKCN